MHRQQLRTAAAVVGAVVLVLAGCRSDDGPDDLEQLLEDEHATDQPDPDPDPEQDPDPEPEPDPDPEPDLFEVPDEIDAAYVDLVMNELLAIDSQLLRDVLSRDPGEEFTEDDAAIVRAIFDGPQLISNGEEYFEYADEGDVLGAFLDPEDMGEVTWSTERVVTADDSCVVAIGWYDLTEVATEPYPEDLFVFASLSPKRPEADASGINPTPWQLRDLNLMQTADGPIPEEDWDRINYEATLETTCISEDAEDAG